LAEGAVQEVSRLLLGEDGPVKLSICIATYNRGRFIAMTLDSIIHQLTPGVELIIVDGASPDNTSTVVTSYLSRYPQISYYREPLNSGVDQDYDKAVTYANGEYCWLMTDDDLVVPGAILRILEVIKNSSDLIVVNSEVCNVDFSEVLARRLLDIKSDCQYSAGQRDIFFAEVGAYLSFIGGVVIRRQLWLERNRSIYYGTLFVHFGVIFQSPVNSVRVIADPVIRIRYGNAMWTGRGFEIWMFKWPQLVWSFRDISDDSKRVVCSPRPYLQSRKLFLYRAIGGYSLKEYSIFLATLLSGRKAMTARAISLCPATLANLLAAGYCLLKFNRTRTGMYDLVRSPYSNFGTRALAYLMGIRGSKE
jgi:abequosyltransferase